MNMAGFGGHDAGLEDACPTGCDEASRTLQLIVGFLRDIGLEIAFGDVPESSFLPGVLIIPGGLRIDRRRLLHVGDLLHEAGHLAVMQEGARSRANGPLASDPGEEMAAIAWSYAAAVYLSLAADVVFHPQGYGGDAEQIVMNFRQRRYIGVPLLQCYGMTASDRETESPGCKPFPHMIRWLR